MTQPTPPEKQCGHTLQRTTRNPENVYRLTLYQYRCTQCKETLYLKHDTPETDPA